MAALANNNVHLRIDGVLINAYFKAVNIEPSSATVDVTRGSNTSHMQRAPGLVDHSLSITLGYDTDMLQTYIQKLRVGQRVTVEYGPEGALPGKPRHVQDFIITGNGAPTNVDKSEVVFEISGEAADAPAHDMWAGAVFA